MQLISGRKPAPARSLHVALIAVAVGGFAIGAVELAVNLVEPAGPVWAIAGFTLVAWVYLAAGIVAWWRRPSNRVGAVMVLGAGCWFAANLYNSPSVVMVAVGAVLATTPLAAAVHLLHAFPSGRLDGTPARITVAAGYLVAVLLQLPLILFRPADPSDPLLWVADRPELVAAGDTLQSVAGALVMIATTVLLLRRIRRAGPGLRRILVPFFAYGIFAVLFVPVISSVIRPILGLSPPANAVLQLAVLAGLPTVFALGIVRGRFARTGDIEELASWLGAAAGSRLAVVDALARTLGDPSLTLAFWVPDLDGYVDAWGSPMTIPHADSGRSTVTIELAEHRVGAILFDPAVVADLDMVRAAGRVVAIAADRERLTAELRANREELRRSRARIAHAGDIERQRVARDLHDGLQVRLLLLAVQAQQVGGDFPAAQHSAVALRLGIDAAAAELRGIVQSIMPAALIERGLSAAIDDLIDRMPLPTRLDLDLPDHAVPADTERAAYFIVAEGLTNALKHSQARALVVRMRCAHAWLTVEVSDDGVGGASISSGSGLRGLADRADVLGGTMDVGSPPGQGTRLVARLPCGS